MHLVFRQKTLRLLNFLNLEPLERKNSQIFYLILLPMSNKQVIYQNLGVIDYQNAWDYQTELFDGIIAKKIQNRNEVQALQPTPNYFLLCEHPHVYTLGKSGSIENVLLSEAELKEKKIDFYKINRGGDITYHGYGQIVGYPILDLDNFSTDIHWYMRSLEEVIIRSIADFGLQGERLAGFTGVWLDIDKNPRKICAMGVKTSRWVTMHGFALNVNTDLKFFEYIVPCGIKDKAVTSMAQELDKKVAIEEVESRILHHFAEVFEAKIFV
jgi:lipoyl(octanoyl) transferase